MAEIAGPGGYDQPNDNVDWLEEVEQQVRERPLTSVLTALGVGFVVGMLVTRR